jgi:hypothetical protein
MDGYHDHPRESRVTEKWRVRLAIESLEARALFHVGGLVSGTSLTAGALAAAAARNTARTHQAPRIIDFTGVQEGPNEWTFQGRVVGDNAAGLTVQLGGIPALEGQTVTTDGNGEFRITVRLGPKDRGTATAQTTDQWGDTSNLARTPVDPGAYFKDQRRRPQ